VTTPHPAGPDPDPDRVAAAVLACPVVAGLNGGRFGEAATYLPGRRVTGVRITPDTVAVHLVGRYPAPPVGDIDQAVRAALAPHLARRPLTITIEDYAPPAAVLTTTATTTASSRAGTTPALDEESPL